MPHQDKLTNARVAYFLVVKMTLRGVLYKVFPAILMNYTKKLKCCFTHSAEKRLDMLTVCEILFASGNCSKFTGTVPGSGATGAANR